MQPDVLIQETVLFPADEMLRRAKITGKHSKINIKGKPHLAAETPTLIRLGMPKQDLSPNNMLVLNLKLPRPVHCSFIIKLLCSTRARGMAENDHYFSVFHSHPDHPNLPSEFDRQWALPWFSYLITSVEQGVANQSRSWRLTDDRDRFKEEKIIVTN